MKHVFVDSGGFFAHLVSEDALHARARELFAQAEREDWHLVTTNAVVYETHALLINRAREGREAGLRFLEHVQRGLCEIVHVTQDDEARAISILRDHQDKTYSFCDALSFVVMGRPGPSSGRLFGGSKKTMSASGRTRRWASLTSSWCTSFELIS